MVLSAHRDRVCTCASKTIARQRGATTRCHVLLHWVRVGLRGGIGRRPIYHHTLTNSGYTTSLRVHFPATYPHAFYSGQYPQ